MHKQLQHRIVNNPIRISIKMVRKVSFLVLFTLMVINVTAQDKNLEMIARPMPDSIILRWAPTNYSTWRLGNQFGYKILRYTVTQDSVILENREEKLLVSSAIKPLPLEKWEFLVKSSKYGGLAAQAIYGKSFTIEAEEGLTPENVHKRSEEQKQRFSFALYAADMSQEVAKASGLWLADTEVKPNEKYLYRVVMNLPDSLAHEADTGFVFTGVSEYVPLPQPAETRIEVSDKLVRIGWNVFAQDNIFMAWEVARSENKNKGFELLTEEPIVPLFSEKCPAEYQYYIDSIPQFHKKYYYKVRGINSFGQLGEWSEPLEANAYESLKGYPLIKSHTELNGQVLLNWEFPLEDESKIEGFKLLRSEDGISGFSAINEVIKSDQRVGIDQSPMAVNYYKIVAFSDQTGEKESPVYLVQKVDSVPPIQPNGLVGTADSTGKIFLSWNKNQEDDLEGYMVFKSASNNDEYSLMTRRAIPENRFMDSVQKNDLNSGVYYRIIAVDKNYNQSEFSKTLFVEKVDVKPPSFPVLTQCKASQEGINLTWIASTSNDVSQHKVYRQVHGEQEWLEITEIPQKEYTKELSYTDKDLPATNIVRYKVVAVDHAGNLSEPAVSIDIQALRGNDNPTIDKIQQQVDYEKGRITLSWQQPQKPVRMYKVYRKTINKGYSIFETLVGTVTSMEDYGMKAGNFYAYRVKVYYVDGGVSGLSEEVKINF